jgi:uncharacterized membrane protein
MYMDRENKILVLIVALTLIPILALVIWSACLLDQEDQECRILGGVMLKTAHGYACVQAKVLA